MERSSSTFSSERRILALLLLVPAALWVFWFAAGNRLASRLGTALGDVLLRVSKGRIMDPEGFVARRLYETVCLATLLCLLAVVGLWLERWASRRVRRVWQWVPLSIYLFVACNVFVGIASQTGLYWGALMMGGPNLKQSAFHAERIRLEDSPSPCKVAIIGSSQGNAQISAGQLNGEFYPKAEFANLSYAGAQAFDFLLIQDFYASARPNVVICYLSKLNLYTPTAGGRFLPLLTTRGWQDFSELAPDELQLHGARVHGLQGMLSPVFRSRRAIELGIFGTEAGEAVAARSAKRPRDAAEAAPSAAAQVAATYRTGAEANFQKRAFRRFVERNASRNAVTVVIKGQMNPLVESLISADVADDFEAFLLELSHEENSVVVLSGQLPLSAPEAYSDFAHVRDSERERFTAGLAVELRRLLERAPSPSGS